LTKLLEGQVEPATHLSLALLLVELVWVVRRSLRPLEGQGGVDDLCEELHVALLLLADHDEVLEVEVDDHHGCWSGAVAAMQRGARVRRGDEESEMRGRGEREGERERAEEEEEEDREKETHRWWDHKAGRWRA